MAENKTTNTSAPATAATTQLQPTSSDASLVLKELQPEPTTNAAPPAPRVGPAGLPERDPKGRLTRRGMEHVLNSGGSFHYKGKVITRHDQLPSATEVAAGDPEAERAARADIERQKAVLQAQLDQLDAPLKK